MQCNITMIYLHNSRLDSLRWFLMKGIIFFIIPHIRALTATVFLIPNNKFYIRFICVMTPINGK